MLNTEIITGEYHGGIMGEPHDTPMNGIKNIPADLLKSYRHAAILSLSKLLSYEYRLNPAFII